MYFIDDDDEIASFSFLCPYLADEKCRGNSQEGLEAIFRPVQGRGLVNQMFC